MIGCMKWGVDGFGRLTSLPAALGRLALALARAALPGRAGWKERSRGV